MQQPLSATRLLAAAALLFGCEAPPQWPKPRPRDVAGVVLFVGTPRPGIGGDRPADGTQARPYSTIGEAVRRAPPGALIRIDGGIYEEELVLRSSIALVGRGPARTRLVAVSEGHGPLIAAREAGHVELRGIAVEGGTQGVLVEGGSVSLEDVSLRGQREVALSAKRSDVVFTGSEVLTVRSALGRGLDLQGGSLVMRTAVMRGAGRVAVKVVGAKALIEDVDAQGPGMAAVHALQGSEVRVEGGRFSHFAGAALYASAARLSVRGASIFDSEYGAMAFRGARLDLVEDQLRDTLVAAVALVAAGGRMERCSVVRGGSEGGVSVNNAKGEVRLLGNRIFEPGPMGVHVTQSRVVAQGNLIEGARLDRDGFEGDAFFAMDAELVVDRCTLRGNAGSGIALTRSTLRLTDTSLRENGQAGLLLQDGSRATASGNAFEKNVGTGVALIEQSRAILSGNRFDKNGSFDVDADCANGSSADLRPGNSFDPAPARLRRCP